MKKVFILIGMFSALQMSCGQNQFVMIIKTTGLTDPDQKIFYFEYENTFTVSVTGVNTNKLVLKASYGELSGSNGQYRINIPRTSPQVIRNSVIEISYMNNSHDTILVDSVNFALRYIPDPVVIVAGRTGGSIPKNDLLKVDSIVAVMQNCFALMGFPILSFTVSVQSQGVESERTQTNGNGITPQQKDLFRTVTRGAKLRFYDIKARGPRGDVHTLCPVELVVQ